MKRRDLLKHLRQHGCRFVREGDATAIVAEKCCFTRLGRLIYSTNVNRPECATGSLSASACNCESHVL